MTEFKIRVHYPRAADHLVLRTGLDWERDVEPLRTSADGSQAEFELTSAEPFVYFKPVLVRNGRTSWAVGANFLALASNNGPREVYPYFAEDATCSHCELRTLESADGTRFKYRVFYPPGYAENTLKRYPVLYMHDCQNLFFREEAFQGESWRIRETLELLTTMNAVEETLVVGVYPREREVDYTKPGYAAYGDFLCDVLKPRIDAEYRTLETPEHTGVMGSSLGGVASFFLAWDRPEVFGRAACLSSTFGWRDDLRERVSREPKRPVRLYLDSGWPADNYEVTRDMRDLLRLRGYQEGADLLYLAFPEAMHNERAWAMRCHIPYQYLFGRSQ